MFSWVTFEHLARWTGGTLSGGASPSDLVTQISTDTRSIHEGDVFLALRGNTFDGHDYSKSALSDGAKLLIVDKPTEGPILLVSDTLQALVSIGRELRNEFKGPVFAVTGSAGKSTTREMIATLLGDNVLRSPASFNNLIGVSKTMFLIEDDTKFVVLEMGMNARYEIKELCENFRPNGGLITNIGDAHMGRVGGREGVYLAKKELFDFLATVPKDELEGVAVNLDDEKVVKAFRESFGGGDFATTFSTQEAGGLVHIVDAQIDSDTGHLELDIEVEAAKFQASVPIFGLHNAQNIAAAIAAARLLDVPVGLIEQRLPFIIAAPHRGALLRLKDERLVVDESYNSNPAALTSALGSFFSMPVATRRVLVLGEMLEQGEFAQEVHIAIGQKIVEWSKAEPEIGLILVGVGEHAGHVVEEVRENLPQAVCYFASTVKEASELVCQFTQPGDAIFVKGSRGNQLDRLVTTLSDKFPPYKTV